ncbi:MAG: hypothetical protein M0Z94_19620 [Dehalococcoidales bacterium]|nr:hypothetical protein [Dehalococcoidales bacterium]
MSRGSRSRQEFSFDARYGRLIRKAGIGTIPFALFHYQAELDLTPQEVWLVGYVLSHRWTSELPFPALREMARRSGVTTKTLEKYKKGLEGKGYLEVVRRTRPDGGNTSIGWDFSPLFELIDRLITRDIEQWVQRNPQFLEEELPSLGDNTGDYAVDNSPPVVRGYHGPGVVGSPGARGQGYYGAGEDGEYAPSTQGNTLIEEDTFEQENAEIGTPGAGKAGQRKIRTTTSSSSKRPRSAGSSFVPESPPETRLERLPPSISPLIDKVVVDYSTRLHDAPKSFRSNCTRARRLWDDSGLPTDDFVGLLHRAYETTEENAHRIRKSARDGPYGARNKMPYFFSVLAGLVEKVRRGEDDGSGLPP